MSHVYIEAVNPKTKEVEEAVIIEHFYSKDEDAIKFSNECKAYPMREIEIINRKYERNNMEL